MDISRTRCSELVIYNGYNLDGKAAALAAWTKLRSSAAYLSAGYSSISALPVTLRRRFDKIYILALHLSRESLERLSDCAKSIVIIDGTDGEFFRYNECDYSYTYFDGRSSCCSSWAYFHPVRVLPRMFEIIEDVVCQKSNIPNSLYAYYGLESLLLGVKDRDLFLHGQQFFDTSMIINHTTEGYHYYAHVNQISKQLAQSFYVVQSDTRYGDLAFINCPKIFNRIVMNYAPVADYYFLYEDVVGLDGSVRNWTVIAGSSDQNANELVSLFAGFGFQTTAGFVSNSTGIEFIIEALRAHDE